MFFLKEIWAIYVFSNPLGIWRINLSTGLPNHVLSVLCIAFIDGADFTEVGLVSFCL